MRTKYSLALLLLAHSGLADNNFLTGSNDIIAVLDEYGDLAASPFSVQFGKKDIWLPRSGHIVKMKVNSEDVPVGMVLDSEGRAYFPRQDNDLGKRQYRFWSALLGLGEGNPKHRTTTATSSQLSRLGLLPGVNTLEFQVTTTTGTTVTTQSNLHLINNTSRLVVSDIDGTVTKSNIRGFLLPVLGLSDWKHEGVVELYSKIGHQGYTLLYLTNRAIGQSDMTRQYINSITENQYKMPEGPILLQVDSLLGAFQTEVITGQPEVNKIALLSRIRGLFQTNPFVAGFGNKAWDILAYKALNIDPMMIYNVDESSNLVIEGSGVQTTYREIINNITEIFPPVY